MSAHDVSINTSDGGAYSCAVEYAVVNWADCLTICISDCISISISVMRTDIISAYI